MIKTQFMSFWDGLMTDSKTRIMIIGATNRPQDVDAAILRRMPSMFLIGLPVSGLLDSIYCILATELLVFLSCSQIIIHAHFQTQPQRRQILEVILDDEPVSWDYICHNNLVRLYSGTCPNDHLHIQTICLSRPVTPGPNIITCNV